MDRFRFADAVFLRLQYFCLRYNIFGLLKLIFACYRIFSLFLLSLPCVSFNAQDIDLTEQIYEIETPRWSDALGWGVVFPMGLFHPPGSPPRVRIGQMMSPPLSL